MFNRYLTRHLGEGEEVLAIVRRYPWSMVFPALVAMVILLAPFFFLFPLLRLGSWGVLLILLLMAVGLFLCLRLVVLYSLNALILTTKRLIDVDQRGFFHRVVSESTYEKIQDVSFSLKGIGQTLFRYGTVHIQTAGSQVNLEIHNVRHPERVQELITRIQTEMRESNKEREASISAGELIELLTKLKRGLGDERFSKLLRDKER